MPRPNVLLVVLDGVRARNTSLHGHERATTPFLSSFAASATAFEQARSPGIWSLPSHASIFSGLHVAEHGLVDLGERLRPGLTVWEHLADREGYATGVFSENTWLTAKGVGLKSSFDAVVGAQNAPFPEADDPNRPYHRFASRGRSERLAALVGESLGADRSLKTLANGVATAVAWTHPGLVPEGRVFAGTPGELYTDRFLDWSARQPGPWAACVNYLDAHFPYRPPADHDRWGGPRLRRLQASMDDQVWEFNGGARPWWQRHALESLYDGAIRYMDAELERLFGALAERGDLEDTLVVVTADHGEGFGEPSRVRPDMRIPAHLAGLHECLLHVPLVVRPPGGADGRVVEAPATLTNFPAVVGAALDGAASPGDAFVPDGPVLASSHGLEEPMADRARRYVDDVWRFDGDAYAVYEPGVAGVRKHATWRDSYEVAVTSVSAREAYVSGEDGRPGVEAAFDAVADRDATVPADAAVDAATERRLAALGYR